MAVRPELGRAAVGLHGAHLALHALEALGAACARAHPVLAHLQVHHVAFLEVDDLVGDAGQRHGVAREEPLALALASADAQHQRGAFARADDAARLVAAEDGDGVGAAQASHGALHGLEQVAFVELVHEVGDHLRVGLAREHVAARAQLGAQLVVVLDDAVVHEGHLAGRGAAAVHEGARGLQRPGAVREVGVGVVHGRSAVRGPAGVGDAGAGIQRLGIHLRLQLGHAGGAARALQRTPTVHGHAAGVVAAVLQALQALHEDGNDVARADRADDAAHG